MELRFNRVWVLIWLLAVGSAPFGQAAEPTQPAGEASEKEGVIVGHSLPRADGGWFGLIVEGGRVRLNYYDAMKKPTAVTHLRAALRLNPPGKQTERDVMLPSADGLSLVANRPQTAPWNFTLTITLIQQDESPGETITFTYRHADVIANAPKAAP
ncbi:MAG: hypothetical protein EAZ36_01190 [Verrucomicrobia bacterium]|nr:MAG: hypothetical protein EAZ36_01190 [Verrucomicrobiota bacterium]